jgi:hypothetical protein
MGLLDDAIREHLELKRRRGTDPREIERLEREALGPVRRGPHEAFEVASAEVPGPDASYGDAQLAEAWPESQDEQSFTGQDTGLVEADEFEDWQSPERGPVEGGIAVEPDAAAPATPTPPRPTDEAPAGGSISESDSLEQETVEHDVEGEHPESAEQEDMLKETPEFLQDTPDHDRLWFEQRPPRDFDLDG